MRVWMIGAEMAPFSKVGGLGDVLGALPRALAGLGCEVTVVIPQLPSMGEALGISPTGVTVEALIAGAWRTAQVLAADPLGGVRVLLIEYPPYFHREGLYGTPAGDYPDNAERFAFFSYAAVEALKRFSPDPDAVHTHDWQTGLVPLLLKAPEHYGSDSRLARAVSVHTIHNLAYQGVFPADTLPRLGVSWSHFNIRELEFYGKINLLKVGLVSARFLTTVSPTYAQEIQTPEHGWGLEGVLRERAGDLRGILNGIDMKAWDPATDPSIPAAFAAEDFSRRAENGSALRAELGLPSDGRPLVGVVSRLVAQKGVDLILGLGDRIAELGVQWAILGSGEAAYEAALARLARKHGDTVAVKLGFEDGLGRRIYAGADIFCMPSLFEPCGLGQMIALRYGSLPVVRRTGGLADTVRDVIDPEGVGFVFEEPTVAALEAALRRATEFVRDPRRTRLVIRRAMRRDFSWKSPARRYLELYGAGGDPGART